MSTSNNILRFMDFGNKTPPKTRAERRDQREQAALMPELLNTPSRLKPQHLIGLLFAHGSRTRRANMPRASMRLSVFTPSGTPAIKVHF